ncbi:hypothetical protein V1224_04685 [Lachnospiraceae bacterium JLR.KK008]
MNDALTMSVSQIFQKDGKKYAFVSFSDGTRNAEGKIPDCVITTGSGFSQAELVQLEDYMKRELPGLKKMASRVNAMKAFMDA